MSTSARAVALSVLSSVLQGAYLAPTLSAALDESRLEGHERSFATDLAYGVLRRLDQIDHALEPLLKAPDRLPSRTLGALRLGAYEMLFRGTPPYAAVNAWVAQVKGTDPRLAGLTNAVLRRVEAPSAAPDHVRANLPEWLLSEFGRALGAENALEAAEGMLQPEPLWLTVFGEEGLRLLNQDGVELAPLVPDQSFPASYRVRSPLPLAELAAFRLGHVQPQNPSSLQVALALGAEEGDHVHDLASGRGIKTAVFAATGARTTAFELSGQRTRAAQRNLQRLGLSAQHRVVDLTSPPDAPPAPFVVLDAPCSGTGTLRGHPEIKLRLTHHDVSELAELQLRLLTSAAALVQPGGVLLYAVCALTEAEGPGVVERFLELAPGYAPEPVALPLATVQPAGGRIGTYIMPTNGLDGFYVARLRLQPE